MENPHPLQKAFIEAQALPCGFCVSGMILTEMALIDRNPNPTDTEVNRKGEIQ
jgi:nicotinate dehydrogenase subunit A